MSSHHSHHYPLHGLELDFDRYVHRPLGVRDVLINRIIENLRRSKKVKLHFPDAVRLYHQGSLKKLNFGAIKSKDRQLGLDFQLVDRMLATQWAQSPSGPWPSDHGWETLEDLSEVLIQLLRQHFFETDAHVHALLSYGRTFYFQRESKPAPGWNRDMIDHLKSLNVSQRQHELFLFSGSSQLPINGPNKALIPTDLVFVGPLETLRPVLPLVNPKTRSGRREMEQIIFPRMPVAFRGRLGRSTSTPPERPVTMSIRVQLQSRPDGQWEEYKFWQHPQPVSKLERLCRRRSLSRTHIRNMFQDKPEWRFPPSKVVDHPCSNCAQYTHLTKDCPSFCGYCNSDLHISSNCNLKATNRCKCRPFPQFHTAFRCFVRCSRRCGSAYPAGHFKHRNAMLCPCRCAMCGIRGHTARKCSFKKCPCGGQHLGQDCRWKVECPAKECDRYLCPHHCRECGKKRDNDSKFHFVGRTCRDCLNNGRPSP
ncbi:hypothetical protein F4778DRAFT_343203 [Xylariomycetidae sp. FL2044]|nr:hypothetical protein F4778DRAFT_343203 [Xylariomycetidae sp. FL2044]